MYVILTNSRECVGIYTKEFEANRICEGLVSRAIHLGLPDEFFLVKVKRITDETTKSN